MLYQIYKYPYLYSRNVIYNNQNQLGNLSKFVVKKEAFQELSIAIFGSTPALNDTTNSHSLLNNCMLSGNDSCFYYTDAVR